MCVSRDTRKPEFCPEGLIFFKKRKDGGFCFTQSFCQAPEKTNKTQKTNRGVLNLQVAIHIVLHKNLLGKKKQNQVPVPMILQPYKKSK